MEFDKLVNQILIESSIIKLGKFDNTKLLEYIKIVYSWGEINPINEKESFNR